MSNQQVPILVSWSGGKDTALALYEIMKTSPGPIELFTTLNAQNSRVAMHGFGETLLDKQALSLGLPLHKLFIPDPCSNEEYGKIMEAFLVKMKNRGADQVVFGDLFLEDIHKYREENLKKIGKKAIFPLWDTPTTNIALKFIHFGFKAVITCVDTAVLPKEFSGREFSMDLLGDLPLDVDPCGENGEFHTFVYDGPLFTFPVRWFPSEQVLRYDRFCYTNIISQ